MRIEIETDGSFEGTRVLLNGREQANVLECDFRFSRLQPGRGKPCLHLVTAADEQGRRVGQFSRYFGNDFQKYDEFFPAEGQATEGRTR